MNFNSILIGSEDPKRLADFYTKLFGQPSWDMGGYTGWLIGSGSVTVGPHDQVKGKNASPGRLIWNIESADVKGDFERFKSAGATVIADPYTMEGDETGSLIATFADPDDNYFQLATPMEPTRETADRQRVPLRGRRHAGPRLAGRGPRRGIRARRLAGRLLRRGRPGGRPRGYGQSRCLPVRAPDLPDHGRSLAHGAGRRPLRRPPECHDRSTSHRAR